jgi:uncharacterized protein (TIGR02099 family)
VKIPLYLSRPRTRIKTVTRFCARLIAGAGLLLVIAFASAVLWLRYVTLPHVETWRPEIVASIEKASGMDVDIRRLQGGWYGLRPSLSMEGFRLRDRKGKAVVAFARAEVTLSWWALLFGEVRFHDVDLDRPELVLRRGADGLVYLADKPLNPDRPGDDGAFSRWLLAQPSLQVHEATLVWRDEKAGAPEVRLTNVEINMRRKGRHHLAALTGTPPRDLAGPIDLRADLLVERQGEGWDVTGSVYGTSPDTNLARLREVLPLPETLRTGVGGLRAWVSFNQEGIQEITADLNLRDAKAQLAADALPLDLASVAGRAVYRAEPSGFYFGTEGLRLRTASGMEARPASFSLLRRSVQGQGPRGEVRADGIDLKIAAALVESFPVPRDLKDQVLRFAPRGIITKAALTWSGENPAKATALEIRGTFDNLAVNAVEGFPGVTGLTGSLEGTEKGGTLRLASREATFELAHVFRAPLRIDTLEARAHWKRDGAALEVAVDEARVANADLQGVFAGTWRTMPGTEHATPGFLDMKGTFSRVDARAVANYLPARFEVTQRWLDAAILAGHSPRASFTAKGNLWHFPWRENQEGHFLFEGELRDARLKYHPDWPSIDAIDGTLRFEGTRMEIRADSGAIFASRVKKTSAVIADLALKPPVLEIAGEVDTAGADTARFLRESPLATGPGAFTRAVQVEGPARLALKMTYPLWGTEPARIAGDYQFIGATAMVGKSLSIGNVKGRLSFTERSVRAPELTGTMFNNPAVVRIASQPDGSVVTQLEGRIATPVLGAFVPEAIAARLDGSADWKAKVVSGRDGIDLALESDLKGLASTLPAPFAKAADQPRSLAIDIRHLGAADEYTTATLAGGIRGRFSTRGAPGAERWQAALVFGAAVESEPMKDGIWLYGTLPDLDVDAWLAVFAPTSAAPAAPAPERDAGLGLRGFDLKLGHAVYTQRDFDNLGVRLERNGTEWKGRIDSVQIAGDIAWNPAGRGRVVARLAHLAMKPSAKAEPRGPAKEPTELPALDIVAERFDFKDNELGRLELRAEAYENEWRIEKLDIVNGHAQFRSSGAWRRTGPGSITTLDLKLDNSNLNALFAQFGFGDYVKRGQAKLEGKLAWPGFPNEFELGNLTGSFRLEAKGGQFAKIEPGAGKLLGLLSLQSIPRRVTFDFRDVFSDGFAFESITSHVKVARGILLTDDFEITGPAAFVSMSGEVSLPQETQKLTMRVVPEVGESVALAATLIGTPVLGLSTLVVSKLLQNPLGKVVAYEYQVTGSWDNPSVTRLSAPALPAPKAAAAPAKTVTP